jgi:DNA repair protein RadC
LDYFFKQFNKIIAKSQLSKVRVQLVVRIVLKQLLKIWRSNPLILCHNHPSGTAVMQNKHIAKIKAGRRKF